MSDIRWQVTGRRVERPNGKPEIVEVVLGELTAPDRMGAKAVAHRRWPGAGEISVQSLLSIEIERAEKIDRKGVA